jgi:hypothetical protein
VREAYLKLLALPAPYAERAHASLTSALTTLLTRFKSIATDTNEDLRLYLIILENPLFLTPTKTTLPLVEKLVTAILSLQQSVRYENVSLISPTRFSSSSFFFLFKLY